MRNGKLEVRPALELLRRRVEPEARPTGVKSDERRKFGTYRRESLSFFLVGVLFIVLFFVVDEWANTLLYFI